MVPSPSPLPPPPPPPAWAPPTPPSASTKNYLSARQSELEAIRAKGLAKIFNRHFTSVTETIAREREAAETALAELERRKEEIRNRPKEFHDANGYTLTQLESMSLELQKRKLEVQRKERENMELYRRYVSQFGAGDTTALMLNRQKRASSSPNNDSLTIVHEVDHDDDDEDDNHRSEDAPLPTDSLVKHQTDLFLAKLMEDQKKGSASGTAAPSSGKANVNTLTRKLEDGSFYGTPHPPGSPSSPLHTKPSPYSKYSPRPGAMSPDSAKAMSPHPNNHNKGATLKDTIPTSPRRTSAPKAQDFPSTDSTSPATPDSASDDASGDSNAPISPTDGGGTAKKTAFSPGTKSASSGLSHGPLFGVSTVTTGAAEDDVPQGDDDSDDSLMSGLTSMDGATIAEAEFKLTEFLRSETDNIRKMLMGGNNTGNDDSFSPDDTSTIVSADSRRGAEAAKAAEDMARQMADATAWMTNPSSLVEDDDDEKEPLVSPQLGSALSPGEKKEWFAYWSLDHQREYYHNVSTNQTSWTKPQNVEIDMSTFHKPKIATGADEEGGVVVQDYTKQKIKKKEDTAMLDNMAMIEEFRPDTVVHRSFSGSVFSGGDFGDATSVASGSTRKTAASIMEFRRRRARLRRKRRIRILVLVAGMSTACAALFYSRDRWLPLMGIQVPQQQSTTDVTLSKSQQSLKKKSKRKKSASKKIQEEDEALNAVREKAAKEEKKRKGLEERKRKAAAAAKVKALEEERARQELIAKTREEERRKLEEAAREEEEAEDLAARAREEQQQQKKKEVERAASSLETTSRQEEKDSRKSLQEKGGEEDKTSKNKKESKKKKTKDDDEKDKSRRGRFMKHHLDDILAKNDPFFDLEELMNYMFQ